jgi:hypothetical protein
MANEKYFEYLDKLRLKGETMSYLLREKLAQEFGLPTRKATEILEEYNRSVPDRKQYLQE